MFFGAYSLPNWIAFSLKNIFIFFLARKKDFSPEKKIFTRKKDFSPEKKTFHKKRRETQIKRRYSPEKKTFHQERRFLTRKEDIT